MNTRISCSRTTVLVFTGDSGLIRLARSILEPACMVIGRAPSNENLEVPAEQPEVVIVDAMSIDLDAILAARRFWPDARIIALSHECREADCVAILDADADYLPRPFRPEDLAARVRVAELRRFNATGRPRTYRNGPLAFDLFDSALTIDGRSVALGPSEAAILSVLAGQPGVVAEYDWLLGELRLGRTETTRHALRSCVLRLRRKIEQDSLHPQILLVEAGVGYRLAEPTLEQAHRAHDSLPIDRERDEPL
jgi:two-component system, OmpR family, KDP operon response regulator KdpE